MSQNNAAAPLPVPTDRELVDELQSSTYEALALKYGVSRGYIYQRAVEQRRRKNEARIQERVSDRKRRQREFFEQVMNATVTCDVLDYLDGLPSGSVDLCVTSPPYNMGKRYGGSACDATEAGFFFGWMIQVLSEIVRSLSDGGVLFLQTGATRDREGRLYPMDAMFMQPLIDMGLQLENRVIWQIPHGLTPQRRLAGRYETALILSKGDPKHFYPNGVRVPQKQPGKRAFKGPRKGQLSGNPFGAHPTDVWSIGNVGHNHPEKSGHPAQMPVALAKRPILLYTEPGSVVMDPFSGSGTTQVAAVETGRAFTGCDLFYDDVRAKRLADIEPDMVSLLPGVTDEIVALWEAEARPVQVDAQPVTEEDMDGQLGIVFGDDVAAAA